MSIWASKVPAVVQESLSDSRARDEAMRRDEIDLVRDFYLGGNNVRKHLIMRESEKNDDGKNPNGPVRFNQRLDRMAYPNYVARLADAIIDGVYGDDVERSLAGATDEQNAVLQSVFDYNPMRRVQGEYAQAQVCYGNGWVNLAWRADDQNIAIMPVDPKYVWYEMDPDVPWKFKTVIEERPYLDGDDEASRFWVWTTDRGRYVNEDQVPVGPQTFDPNPYGLIPYAHLRGRSIVGCSDGLSLIRDQITLQKEVLNRASDLTTLVMYQSFGLIWVKGYGQNRIRFSEAGYVDLGDNGEIGMLAPTGKILEVQQSIDTVIEQMFQTGNVPIDVVKGSISESGVALRIKWMPFERVVNALRKEAELFEKDLIRKVCKIGKYHGMNLPDDPVPVVKFSGQLVPTDETAEFQRDLLMLNNDPQLMTRDDFIKVWRGKKTEEELRQYIEELDAEKPEPTAQPTENPFAIGVTL